MNSTPQSQGRGVRRPGSPAQSLRDVHRKRVAGLVSNASLIRGPCRVLPAIAPVDDGVGSLLGHPMCDTIERLHV
jgi:hypothetical protein